MLTASAQVGIGTAFPDSSAQLELSSATRGFLAPRMSSTQMTAIARPATGLTVYNTDSNRYFVYTGTSWIQLLSRLDTVAVARSLSDADTDTRITVEQTPDIDQIGFSLGGKEYFRMQKGTLQFNNTSGCIYLGEGAGLWHDYTNNSIQAPLANIGIGANALQYDSASRDNIAIGRFALNINNSYDNVAIGNFAGRAGTTITNSVLIGHGAGYGAKGNDNVMLGSDIAILSSNGSDNVFIGKSAAHANAGSSNVFIGKAAGASNYAGSGNVYIGPNVGGSRSMSNSLMIDNSNTLEPLIFGDFAADSLCINGVLNVNGKYSLPKTAGSSGYVMQTDGGGTTRWVAPASLNTVQMRIQDADSDTKVEVEQSADEDMIRFQMGGKEYYRMNKGTLEFNNTGRSIFIGEGSGQNYNYSYPIPLNNVSIGANALQQATLPYEEVAVGAFSLYGAVKSKNTALGAYAGYNAGDAYSSVMVGHSAGLNCANGFNTMLGFESGYYSNGISNTYLGARSGRGNAGSGNICIGFDAGSASSTDSQLFVDITNTVQPLIFGDFAKDSLRINGSLNINGYYTLPKSAGTSGYIMQTDGNGEASWVSPSALAVTETDPQVSSSSTGRYAYWNGTTLTDGNIHHSSNGNIGIGVTNAALPLEVGGTVRFSSSTNADIQLNSGVRPTIYPNGANVPANLDVQLRSAGTGTLLLNADNTGNISAVSGGGNLMVGTGTPAARLDVGGTFKLGTAGSVLTSVIKSSYTVSTSQIGANASVAYTITVTGAAPGASVSVSPNADMPNGVHIASARVSAANTVTLKIYNATGSAVSLSGITGYYIAVIN